MRSRLVPVVVVGLVLAGCAAAVDAPAAVRRDRTPFTDPATDPGTDPVTDDTTAPASPEPRPIVWNDIGNGMDEGRLEVPLDRDDPDAGTITLYLVRHRALDSTQRIGTLLVNPGGPGFGGTGLAWSADSVYGERILEHFDVVGWDPRGTGFSEPAVDCIDDYDRYFGIDSSPDTAAERRRTVDLAEEFGRQCVERSGELLDHVSTVESAHDMDDIRRALGEDTISYFGFSYGSELGAVWATLHPDTVRAAVLDGAVDPTVGYLEQNVQQAAGFEAAFGRFLDRCAADTECPFHRGGDPAAAFDELSAAADADPIVVDPRRAPVTHGVLMAAVASALYDESAWPLLARALDDLADGDGSAVLGLYDDYYGRWGDRQWDDSMEAYFAVNCLDDHGATDAEEVFTLDDELTEVAPRLGRSWLLELVVCATWPAGPADEVRVTGEGAGQILVVGTTGDPATPLTGTRAMADALAEGRLVVVDAERHTGYGVDECVDEAVEGYLLDPTAPLPDEIDCA